MPDKDSKKSSLSEQSISAISLPPDSKIPNPADGLSSSAEYDLYFCILRDKPGLLKWSCSCLAVCDLGSCPPALTQPGVNPKWPSCELRTPPTPGTHRGDGRLLPHHGAPVWCSRRCAHHRACRDRRVTRGGRHRGLLNAHVVRYRAHRRARRLERSVECHTSLALFNHLARP
jgi:hypothetical protein